MPYSSGLTSSRYLLAWLALLADRGISPEDILKGIGLERTNLDERTPWLTQQQVERAFANSYTLTGDDGLGVAVGLTLNLSSHGALGFAGLTAPTTREAVRQMIHYLPVVTELLTLGLEEHEDQPTAALVLTPRPGLDLLAERFLVQIVFGSLHAMTGYLHGDIQSAIHMELAMPRSAMICKYFAEAASRLNFDSPCHRLRFPRALLARQLPLADAQAQRQALRSCEEEMAALRKQAGFSGHLYQQLISCQDKLPSIEDIARDLHVSSRTIHRRLRAEGQSFRELVNAARITLAKQYLIREGLDITRTAHQLGYQDSANFSRAFKRSEGVTPSEFLMRNNLSPKYPPMFQHK